MALFEGEIVWRGEKRESDIPESDAPMLWGTQISRNVCVPSLIRFPTKQTKPMQTAVVICPGGAMHYLMMEKEGAVVARWLAAKGVASFILKYTVAQTPVDNDEFISCVANSGETLQKMGNHFEPAVKDGIQALAFLKNNSNVLKINEKKIGMLGFSAGASVAIGCALNAREGEGPDFLGAIYAAAAPIKKSQSQYPPLFLAYANNDNIVLNYSMELYNMWKSEYASVEMHSYSKGGHGFGLETNGSASDLWPQQFEKWLVCEGLLD